MNGDSIFENEYDNNNEKYLYYLPQINNSKMEYYFSKNVILKFVIIPFILITYELVYEYSIIINYMNVDLSIPRNKAMREYQKTGKIVFNDYFDYLSPEPIFNHIHIAMGFNESYAMLSTVSIASILYTAKNDTFLHFHIITLNFTLDTMEKINSLKYKINKRAEFIFYDGKKVETDFKRGNIEFRGVANYCRFLIPELIFDTNKVIMLDSGDILVQKDLLELYNYNINDAYIAAVLDMCAGRNLSYFFRNEKYINVGVAIINNLKMWRKEKLYEKIVTYSNRKKRPLGCPIQDILSVVMPNDKVFLLPLKYNTIQYYRWKGKKIQNSTWVNIYMQAQNNSRYKYSKEEILEAENDPVIRHLWNHKIQYSRYVTRKIKIQWKKYAKMTGFYKIICGKYRRACK